MIAGRSGGAADDTSPAERVDAAARADRADVPHGVEGAERADRADVSHGVEGAGGADRGDGVEAGRPFSGLRNPAAAIRGAGMATLAIEWLVLLLAVQPIRTVAPEASGWAVGLVVALAFACLGVAALLRRPWAWHAGTALQALVIAAGLLLWALFALGAAFLAIWLYVLHVRRLVARPARFDH